MTILEGLWARASREAGLRYLGRRRAACAVAVATLALALGANTLVFAIGKAFVLASFGLPEPGRLFVIAPVRELPGRGDVVFAEAYANYARIRETQQSFADVTVMLQGVASWDTGEEARPLQSARVSASFFPTMRVRPAQGRAFRASEEGPGAAAVVIISHALWRDALAGDPGVIGRTLRINGAPHEVVGVMPPGFAHPLPTDLWLPFDLATQAAWTAVTGGRNLGVYGRLKDGVSEEAARAEMAVLTRRAIEATADNRDFRYTLQSIRQILVPGVDRVILFVQLGAALLVLLAVANLSALLIAWGFDRRTEMAVRLALGAGSRRILRMLVLQGVVVVAMGGMAGALISRIAIPFVRGLDVSPALAIYLDGLRVDGLVLGVSLAVIAVAGVLAGLLPAWFASRADPAGSLRAAGRALSLSPAALRAQKAMVLVQTTLSVVLVCAAAVIGLSFRNLSRVPTGFRTDGAVVARVQLPPGRYPDQAARAAFGTRLLENLDREGALDRYGFTSTLPVGDPGWGGRFYLDPADAATGAEPLLFHIRRISAGYIETMGIPLLEGRGFEQRDDSSGIQVALVSSALAKRLWPHEAATGRRMYRAVAGGASVPVEIIGVVGDVPDGGLTAPPGEAVYVHWPQISVGQMSIVAASSGPADATLAAIRRALRGADPELAASSTESLASIVNQANALPRLASLLLGVFALAAIAMVLLGAYGVMTQLVLSREREFAVRLLFGARPAGMAAAVLGQAARLTLAGIAVGIALAWALAGLLEPLVFGIAPRSVPLLGAVALAVLLLTAAGVAPAALRAATVDIRKGAGAG